MCPSWYFFRLRFVIRGVRERECEGPEFCTWRPERAEDFCARWQTAGLFPEDGFFHVDLGQFIKVPFETYHDLRALFGWVSPHPNCCEGEGRLLRRYTRHAISERFAKLSAMFLVPFLVYFGF